MEKVVQQGLKRRSDSRVTVELYIPWFQHELHSRPLAADQQPRPLCQMVVMHAQRSQHSVTSHTWLLGV